MPSYCCNGPDGGARDPAQDEHFLRQFRSLILALVTHHGGAQLFFEEAEVHEWRQRMVVFLQGYLRECAEEEVDLEELEERPEVIQETVTPEELLAVAVAAAGFQMEKRKIQIALAAAVVAVLDIRKLHLQDLILHQALG